MFCKASPPAFGLFLADEQYPHGIIGHVYPPGTTSSNGSPFHHVAGRETEVDVLIEQAIAETGASAPSDLGKVMGLVMGRAKGRTDGRAVQERVRRRLGS